MRSLEVDGVNPKDRPDFVDAYINSRKFEDGTKMSDKEMDMFTDKYPEVVNQLAHESLY